MNHIIPLLHPRDYNLFFQTALPELLGEFGKEPQRMLDFATQFERHAKLIRPHGRVGFAVALKNAQHANGMEESQAQALTDAANEVDGKFSSTFEGKMHILHLNSLTATFFEGIFAPVMKASPKDIEHAKKECLKAVDVLAGDGSDPMFAGRLKRLVEVVSKNSK